VSNSQANVAVNESAPISDSVALITRLEFFHDELVKSNCECKHWKSEFEKLSTSFRKMTRNQTYEVRLLQRAIIASQHSKKTPKPAETHLEDHAKLIVQRNTLLDDAVQRSREVVELNAKLTHLALERRRLAKHQGEVQSSRHIVDLEDDILNFARSETKADRVLAVNNLGVHADILKAPHADVGTVAPADDLDSFHSIQYVQSPGNDSFEN